MRDSVDKMKSELPADIRAAVGTMTLRELKLAITTCSADHFSLGIDSSAGFDSCIYPYYLFLIERQGHEGLTGTALMFATRSDLPFREKDVVEYVNLRHSNKVLGTWLDPKCSDIIQMDLPEDMPVFIGVKTNFSWRGAYKAVPIKVAGPLCYVFASTNTRAADYQVSLEVGSLSVWGEA